MPTVHYISRETLRKHGIDPLQWELLNDKKRRVTTTNDAFATNAKTEVLDGTIRNNNATPGTAATKREEQQPPYKSTGMDDNNNDDVDDKLSPSSSSSTSKLNDVQPVQSYDGKGIRSIQQIEDNVQEDECRKPSVLKRANNKCKPSTDFFFRRVDQLRAYKEKHGHLNLHYKDPLCNFCYTLRSARRFLVSGKGTTHYTLDDDRIAALDAIGFDWEPRAARGVTTTTNAAVTNVINATDVANSGVQQPPQKTIGMEVNNIDAENQSRDGTGINQQMDKLNNLVEGQCLNRPFKPKADGTVKHKQRKDFFDRVDELKAYKEKHGHLNVRSKDDSSLYNFCNNLRRTRSALLTGKGTINNRLDETRIAALDAIGFDWNPGVSMDDKFFDRVDELRAYKEKHGHLNMSPKNDQSLYNFCNNLRRTRRAILTGEGKIHYSLDDSRIAALDAIGFDWELGAGATAASQDDKFFDRVDKLSAYKEKHGHLNVRWKDDASLNDFCHHLRQSRRAILTGKGKINNRLDETRIAALDAIGFNWDPLELKMSSTSPCAMSKSTQQATNPKINIGDVGYRFLKEFDSGWYNGTVIEILPHAIGGWDRRCIYEDGDCEDLALIELIRLATLSPQEHVGTIKVVGDVKVAATGECPS